MKHRNVESVGRSPSYENIRQLVEDDHGQWAHLPNIETPHGECRVLVTKWDSHYVVHVDSESVELFFHTREKVHEWESVTWKKLRKLARAELAEWVK